jgi:hypothetical protein
MQYPWWFNFSLLNMCARTDDFTLGGIASCGCFESGTVQPLPDAPVTALHLGASICCLCAS